MAESEQLRHWFEAAPEQVAQSELQAVQVEDEDLNSLEAQEVQAPLVGRVRITLAESEQLKQSLAVFPPEQVAQSPWQDSH